MTLLRLSKINLWHKHTEAVMEILRRAADRLIENGDRGLEPDLNRQLFMNMHLAIRELEEEGLFVPSGLPVLEAINQPTPKTKGTTSEDKRPDLQWGYRDRQVVNPMEAARTFHIECKRIGTSSLNPLYVKNGVRRFIDDEWRYGKDVADGAMMGYVEGRGPDAALRGVNSAISKDGVPSIIEVSRHEARRELDQELTREFPESPFKLHHIWIDTRPVLSPSQSWLPPQGTASSQNGLSETPLVPHDESDLA